MVATAAFRPALLFRTGSKAHRGGLDGCFRLPRNVALVPGASCFSQRQATASISSGIRPVRWQRTDLSLSSRGAHICSTASGTAAGPAFEALTDIQKGQVVAYINMLMEWNTKMNITAVRDRDEAMLRHVEDSLALLPSIEAHAEDTTKDKPLRLIDVGSGGGLPGLLLAIARPEWEVTLLDSLRKRCDFVSMVLPQIAVTNVQVVWARAEDAGQDPKHREAYDVAVARAVAEMRLLNEFCLPMVRVGGHLVAAKGPDPQAEVNSAQRSLQELGGKLLSITPVESFGREGQQFTSVVVQKRKKCPKKYPRSPGTPKKSPL